VIEFTFRLIFFGAREHDDTIEEDLRNGSAAAQPLWPLTGEKPPLSDEFRGRGAVEVGPPEARRTLQAAVFVQDHARSDERRPGQEVGEALRFLAILGEVHHRVTSRSEMGGIAHVPAHHLDEQRIALRGPHRGHVTERPQHEPGDPQSEPEANRR
jgi:hypothetical protein